MQSKRSLWTLAIVSVALLMVTLDNLVVTNALVSIRRDLGASLEDLEWTVNAYTLSFAVFLLTAAALGDRLGRRVVFVAGLAVFTLASAAAALAPSTDALIASRALQGLGAAVITPLSLTLLSEAFPADRRGLALGVWSGVAGLGVALGPVVGGAVVEGFSWQWIFWLNVPVGLALAPLAFGMLSESRGPNRTLDVPGVALAMFFGAFGSIFLLAQFFQVAQGYSPLDAGIRTLPWTAMPIFIAPIAGVLSDRIGSRPLMAVGLGLQAAALGWLATVTEPDVAYGLLIPAFVMAGSGMALVFAPAANAVLGAVRPSEAGQASGANNTIREIGGVLGVAVLAAGFSDGGGLGSPAAYVDGLVPAVWVGAAVLGLGAIIALFVPGRRTPAAEFAASEAAYDGQVREAVAA